VIDLVVGVVGMGIGRKDSGGNGGDDDGDPGSSETRIGVLGGR
jgi:hypothetical protein